MEPRKIGPYRLEGKLGAGGMGEVFRAFDDRLDRWVAIKVIRPEALDSVEARRRFRREARAVARLSHPAIVQIHDILEDEAGDSIVMELVEGQPLTSLLAEGPLEIGPAIALGRKIAEGLAEAHAKNIVHRDLKTDNVMVTPAGHVKILDFGLAKRLAHPQTELSVEGRIVGTVHAMSPEQAQGFEIDHRSDLFSLGSLLYQTLTCRSPFRGRTPLQTLSRIPTFRQTPVHEVNPRVPEALSLLIDRLLEKDPAHRPQSADEVAEDLATIAATWEAGADDDSQNAATTPGVPAIAPPAEASLSDSPTLTRPLPAIDGRSQRPAPTPEPEVAKQKAVPAIQHRGLVAVSILLLLGLLATWMMQHRDQERLYVGVLRPQVGSAPEAGDSDLLASAVRLALVRALLSLQTISTPDPDEVDTVSGSAAQVARALGVDEVISSSLTCDPRTCQIELKCIPADGSTRWVEVFRVFPGDLLELTSVVGQRLRNRYPEHETRDGAGDRSVAAEDYEEYLRLRQSWKTRSQGISLSELLDRVTALESSSPRFPEAYLLEARIAQSLFTSSGRPADLERALDAAQRARDLAPEDSRALFALVDIAEQGARPELAEEALQALRRVEPGHGRILAQEALLLESRGQNEEALVRMRTAARRHASWSNLMDLARLEIRLGEHDAARDRLRQLLERSPDHYHALFLLANHEMTYGSLEQAAQLFEQLRRQAPADSGTRQNLALVYFGLARYDEATRWFQSVLDTEPDHLPVTASLAFTRFLEGEETSARELSMKALELMDEVSAVAAERLHFLRAMALVPLSRHEQAVAAIQRILPSAHASPFTAWQAALIYAAVDEKLSAKTKARDALEQGLTPRWFVAPVFDFLQDDPEFRTLLESAEGAASSPW